MSLTLRPISFADACAYIKEHHRHHKPPQGWKFGTSVVAQDGTIAGVVMIGRPVSRMLDDGVTVEVIRLCTNDTPNAASMLYGAAWRAAKALGFTRIVTYILESESGTTLRAAGWQKSKVSSKGGSWSRPSRPRTDNAPLEPKIRWECSVQAIGERI